MLRISRTRLSNWGLISLFASSLCEWFRGGGGGGAP